MPDRAKAEKSNSKGQKKLKISHLPDRAKANKSNLKGQKKIFEDQKNVKIFTVCPIKQNTFLPINLIISSYGLFLKFCTEFRTNGGNEKNYRTF